MSVGSHADLVRARGRRHENRRPDPPRCCYFREAAAPGRAAIRFVWVGLGRPRAVASVGAQGKLARPRARVATARAAAGCAYTSARGTWSSRDGAGEVCTGACCCRASSVASTVPSWRFLWCVEPPPESASTAQRCRRPHPDTEPMSHAEAGADEREVFSSARRLASPWQPRQAHCERRRDLVKEVLVTLDAIVIWAGSGRGREKNGLVRGRDVSASAAVAAPAPASAASVPRSRPW